ncbi:hypothetical protein ACFX2K_019522 [Malus domestica]
MGSETRNRVRGSRSSRKSSRGALANVVAENNELRRREEKASRKLAAVTVELEKSKTLQQQVNQPQQPSGITAFDLLSATYACISHATYAFLAIISDASISTSDGFSWDVMRYLGAHGGLAEGFGSQGGSAEGSRAQGGSTEGSSSIE